MRSHRQGSRRPNYTKIQSGLPGERTSNALDNRRIKEDGEITLFDRQWFMGFTIVVSVSVQGKRKIPQRKCYFIRNSSKYRYFYPRFSSLQEEQFEWGNPLNKHVPAKETKDGANIAKAAHRWRKLIQANGPSKRPFVGMRAVIVSASKDESTQPLFNVVKSGGGCLLQAK